VLWSKPAQQQSDRGGLAGIIGAEKTMDAPTRCVQRYLFDTLASGLRLVSWSVRMASSMPECSAGVESF
jgi:hypothetical protein